MSDYFSSDRFIEQFEEIFKHDDRYTINQITVEHLKDILETNRITDESTPAEIRSATQALLNYVMHATEQTSDWGAAFHLCLDMMIQFNRLQDIDGSLIDYVVLPDDFSNGAPDKETLRPIMDKFSEDLATRTNRKRH